ncbi:snaclec coagulation factor IX/factor X-binding protein subunit B3-like [Huso huso]|uniref:Snaclec coagulation factor IX/factor X-binding protein subunit B3-like n=1 Tax=Huso huso TaxID=61971 RepID=A0ABR0YAN9_HUSHU
MNPTLWIARTFLNIFLLFFLGLCVPASNQIRKVYVETVKSWSEAQSYCREKHTDLATVRSQEEAEQLLNITGDSLNDTAWIGLYRDDTQNWQWSNSDDVIYSNWKAELFCASVKSSGEWEDRVCNEGKAFMCYNADIDFDVLFVFTETSNITERYTLIEELKTWTEAQQYCREHHTDLVSIKSASENEDLMKKAQGKPFWIGLFNNPWKWSHQGDNYTFHNWNKKEPNNVGGNENCVKIAVRDDPSRGEWHDKDCSLKLPFFCFDGKAPCSVCVLVQLSFFYPVHLILQ